MDTESRRLTLGSQWQSLLASDWLRVVSLRWEQENYRVGEDEGNSSLLLPGIGFSRTVSDSKVDPSRGWRLQADLAGVAREDIVDRAQLGPLILVDEQHVVHLPVLALVLGAERGLGGTLGLRVQVGDGVLLHHEAQLAGIHVVLEHLRQHLHGVAPAERALVIAEFHQHQGCPGVTAHRRLPQLEGGVLEGRLLTLPATNAVDRLADGGHIGLGLLLALAQGLQLHLGGLDLLRARGGAPGAGVPSAPGAARSSYSPGTATW